MKFRLIFCVSVFISYMFFVCPVWGIGAITFVGADTATHHQADSLSFQDALYEVVDSLGHHEITRIYLYGGGDDDFFVASGSYFEVDSLVDTLDIEVDNSPKVKDHIYIKGDHVHVYGIENSFLYIEISSMITFYGAINIFSYAHNNVVEDCVISGAFTGINNFGKNTEVKHIRIDNCNFGIHSDAESTYIYDARIDSCSVKGIMGDNAAAGSNCMDVTKALISNCPTGCYFYSNIPVTLDRVTVLDFDSLGICNTSSFSYLKCKRCLVYKDSYDAGDYCYVNATFENAWTGTNDNVAMGDDCPGNYDTTGCTASNFTSYDGYPNGLNDHDSDSGFVPATADIYLNSTYSSGWWSSHPNHTARRLAKYEPPGMDMNYHYEDNVGYDTDLDEGEIARRYFSNGTANEPESRLIASAYPNPFNDAINIEAIEDSRIEIYDLSGRTISEIPQGKSRWQPDKSTGSGIYLIRAITLKGHTETRSIIYLK